ncbi:MAG TPA: hypothetical protein VJW20_00670, partial [Candidatus Angelobacter sp.]|nr:hypothetical protein [Candidatus Angelobacter sp.]
RQCDPLVRHQFQTFIEQPQAVHGGFGVISVFADVFRPLPFLAASLLSGQPLELTISKAKELFGRITRKKEISAGLNFLPCDWSNFARLGKQEVQRGGISLGCHAGPLAQRVKRYINVIRTVAALVAGGGPDKMLARLKTKSALRTFNVDAVEIGVVCFSDLRTMEF